jgi:hypothetical protein
MEKTPIKQIHDLEWELHNAKCQTKRVILFEKIEKLEAEIKIK